jgi:hypothetical protein
VKVALVSRLRYDSLTLKFCLSGLVADCDIVVYRGRRALSVLLQAEGQGFGKNEREFRSENEAGVRNSASYLCAQLSSTVQAHSTRTLSSGLAVT